MADRRSGRTLPRAGHRRRRTSGGVTTTSMSDRRLPARGTTPAPTPMPASGRCDCSTAPNSWVRLVGLNLPYDLTRLAVTHATRAGPAFEPRRRSPSKVMRGGLTFKFEMMLWPDGEQYESAGAEPSARSLDGSSGSALTLRGPTGRLPGNRSGEPEVR